MLTEDRKQELMFYVRNKMPIIVCMEEESTIDHESIEDTYTLQELEEAGLLIIVDQRDKYITVCVSAPEINMYTGTKKYRVCKDNILNFYII